MEWDRMTPVLAENFSVYPGSTLISWLDVWVIYDFGENICTLDFPD